MMTYFVSDKGEVRGPFAESQLLQMWNSGHITVEAQVCEQGSQDWFPASMLMKQIESSSIADERTRRAKPGCVYQATRAGLVVMVVLLIIVFLTQKSDSTGTSQADVEREELFTGRSSIKTWIAANLADPQARLVAVGRVMKVGEWEMKKARVAARNKLGGPIMEDMIFSLSGHVVIEKMTVDEFAVWMGAEERKLDDAAAAKLREQVKAFARAPLYSL